MFRGDNMKDKGKAWLLAFVMGVVLPGVMISLGARFMPVKSIDKGDETTETTQLYVPTEPIQQENMKTIMVLQADGQVIPMNLETYLIGVVLGEMPASLTAAS